MAMISIDSLKEFYEVLIKLKHRETLIGRLNIHVKCLGPELPYVKGINNSFYSADHMIIRFDTKMVRAGKNEKNREVESIDVKVVGRYYFHLFRKESHDMPFGMVKFNYINPWEYMEEENDIYITTETVSDKVPVRIDLREYNR